MPCPYLNNLRRKNKRRLLGNIETGAHYRGNKGRYSGYAKKKSSIFKNYRIISGIAPSI
jgi:hypothetical protein